MVFLHVLEWNRFLTHLAESEVPATMGLVQEKGIGRDEPFAGESQRRGGKGREKWVEIELLTEYTLPKAGRVYSYMYILGLSLFQSQSLFPMRGAS